MKKTAIYCRIDRGGNEETQRDVLKLQKNRLEAYAKENGLEVVANYEDVGYSGHDMTRPGLTRLLEDHKSGKFEAVLVVNYDRLFRGNYYKAPEWAFEVLTPLRVVSYFRVGTKEQILER